LYECGFANQPVSTDRNDGLQVVDCYITAVLHCAPPQNRPIPSEILNCRYFLTRELQLLPQVRVIVALGKVAFDQVWTILNRDGPLPRPKFRHGLEIQLGAHKTLIASFHPSQQNTFTGKLTLPMFHSIFRRARQLIHATSL
jgi:uracil-DNA glycosylase family 4